MTSGIDNAIHPLGFQPHYSDSCKSGNTENAIRDLVSTLIERAASATEFRQCYKYCDESLRPYFLKCVNEMVDEAIRKQGMLSLLHHYPNRDGSRPANKIRQQQWQQILDTIIEPITDNITEGKVLVEGMNIPRSYLVPEIAKQIIDPKTKRLIAMIGKKKQRRIAFVSYQKNDLEICLYFKEDPVAAGREYLVKELYISLIGHGCVMSELVKFTIDNVSYPVLIIESQSGEGLHQLLKDDPELKGVDSKHKSQLYIASLFEMQEDGKSEHYIRYSCHDRDGNPVYKLNKIDLDHGFIPRVVQIKNKIKLQQKIILYALNNWLDEFIHPEAIEEWLAIDKNLMFENLLNKLIARDHFYYQLFGLDNENNIKILYSRKCPIFIESMVPVELVDEWLTLIDKLNQMFEDADVKQQPLTHRQLLTNTIPLTFKFYQEVMHKFPHDPLSVYQHAAKKNGYIFNHYGVVHADVGGDDLLLSSLQVLPQIEHIRQRRINAVKLLQRFNELKEKNNLIRQAVHELIQNKPVVFFNLPYGWREQVMDALMANEFPVLNEEQQKAILIIFGQVSWQRLRIVHTKALDNKLLMTILRQSPQLLELHLSDCANLVRSAKSNFLCEIGKCCKSLDRVVLENIPLVRPSKLSNFFATNRCCIKLRKVLYHLRK